MGNSQQKKRKKGDYNPWSPEETKLLVQLLVEGINNNWRDSNGTISKLTVETKFMPEINKEFCRSKNYNHYLSRMKYLKIQYQSCLDLQRFSSGFGWDPLTKRFTASDEVWSDYLKVSITFSFLSEHGRTYILLICPFVFVGTSEQ